MEYRAVRPDGSVIWIRNEAEVVRDGQGRALKVFGIAQDITDRKQSEAELLKAKTVAERYLQLAGVMFIGLDSHGKVTLANKKACEILKCDQNEIVGKDWIENFIPEGSRKEVRRVFDRIISGDLAPVLYYENKVSAKTGEKKSLHGTMRSSGITRGTLSDCWDQVKT